MFSFRQKLDGADATLGVAFSDRDGGVTTGPMGSLNLGRTDVDELANVRENFDRVRAALGVDRIITLAQRHTPDVVVVDDDFLADWAPGQHLGSVETGRTLPVADALVTRARGVALVIRVADCVPVVFADADRQVIGAAHAGRVGLAGGVLVNTVAAMRDLGAAELTAWIGPRICGDCYEVPESMRAKISAQLPGAHSETSWGTPSLDLGRAAARQLESLGCAVRDVGECTRTTDSLHSHRRDGADAGRLASFVWMN